MVSYVVHVMHEEVLLVLLLASATSSGSITSTLLERARQAYSTSQIIRGEKNKAENQSKGETHQKCVEDDVDRLRSSSNRRNRRPGPVVTELVVVLTRPLYIYIYVEFKLSDFCLKVVSVPDMNMWWEKCSCHVILCRGRRTVSQGIINVLYQ